ncbi:hypothetical protein G6O67_007723 [Ophiocordyceps sinensis]|uniref:DUF2293 domain-containing protein n=1 Tax=Ophiocordyceps sinensis TaxID=72228 RepID=A0A8H4PM22_9HYPO|nr:hypothetical protein G6O67_007723 [Ophiocordyceps sinensis]
MGTKKRKLPAAAKGVARERRMRARRPLNGSWDPESLVARPSIPKPQTKHHSYFEFVENKEKKKKLHFQNTHGRNPPRGCEFVPVGNPELTTACKELSRERGAQIYIVSDSHANDVAHSYASQMNRVGYHFHKAIVQEARANIVGLLQQAANVPDGEPEPIPESQATYHMQVDAALRDLFPRIPHTDRQVIIQHAFTRKTRSKGERVGLQPDITLARRVQLAVLAHIRHSHTRYDELLKECSWNEARRTVETLCLDILVKWRGDEETGRDQLDEILREIVVISDSEDEVWTDDDSVGEVDTPNDATLSHQSSRQPSPPMDLDPRPRRAVPQTPEPADRRARRGFQRYRRAWDEAVRRRDDGGHFILPRDDEEALDQHVEDALSNSHGSQWHSGSVPNPPAPNGYLAQGPPVYRQVPGNAPTAPVNAAYGEKLGIRPLVREYLSGLKIGRGIFRSTRVCISAKAEFRLLGISPGAAFGSRDLNISHSNGRGNPASVASLPYAARGHEAAASSNHPATDRLVVNASWPGTHSNPILMEDRGGFFERVAGRPELVPPTREFFEVRRPILPVLRAPSRHPTVLQMASRELPDGPIPMRSEVIATRRSGASPSAIDSQSALGPGRVVFSSPWEHDPRVCQEQRRFFAGGYDPHLRPVSGEYRPPSFPPYREESRGDCQSGFVAHAPYEPHYQLCRKRPASDYHHGSYGRENPPRLPFTEHVNVVQ